MSRLLPKIAKSKIPSTAATIKLLNAHKLASYSKSHFIYQWFMVFGETEYNDLLVENMYFSMFLPYLVSSSCNGCLPVTQAMKSGAKN